VRHIWQPRCLPIERDKFPRTGTPRGSRDHHIGKAETVVATSHHDAPDVVSALHLHLGRCKKAFDGTRNIGA